jgi:hypothetical protein
MSLSTVGLRRLSGGISRGSLKFEVSRVWRGNMMIVNPGRCLEPTYKKVGQNGGGYKMKIKNKKKCKL